MTNRIEILDGERDRKRREIAAGRAKLEEQLAALVALAEPEEAVEFALRGLLDGFEVKAETLGKMALLKPHALNLNENAEKLLRGLADVRSIRAGQRRQIEASIAGLAAKEAEIDSAHAAGMAAIEREAEAEAVRVEAALARRGVKLPSAAKAG